MAASNPGKGRGSSARRKAAGSVAPRSSIASSPDTGQDDALDAAASGSPVGEAPPPASNSGEGVPKPGAVEDTGAGATDTNKVSTSKRSMPRGIEEGATYRTPTRKDPGGLENGFVVERDYGDGGAKIRETPSGKVKDVGSEKLADMARKHDQAIKSHRSTSPESFAADKAAYYESLGYAAHSGELHADVPAERVQQFESWYEDTSSEGEAVEMGNNLHVLREGASKWGTQMRVVMPDDAPMDLDFGAGVGFYDAGQGKTQVSNNELFSAMLGKGFRMGASHDKEKIRSSISDPEMRERFDEGWELAEMAKEERRQQ